MNFQVTIPNEEEELVGWLKSVENNGTDFNAKVVNMLKVYFNLVQNIEWTIFDKTIEQRWDTFEDKFNGNISGLTDKLNQKIELLQMQLQESVSKPIQSEFHKLQQTIDVFRGDSRVSSTKGKIGELQIETQIESYFPDCELCNQSKQPHQSDYHLKLYGFTIFIEVKTYQKNVPQKEIVKFYRDLEENPDAQAGIMVSLTSGIANKPSFTYDIDPSSKKPIVFVPNANALDGNTIVWAVLFTSLILKYQETHNTNVCVDGDDKSTSLENAIEMIRNQLQWVQMTIDNISDLKDMSKKHFANITQEADRFQKDLHYKLENSEKILKKNVEIWNSYLSDGSKMILPLPSMSQLQHLNGNNPFLCECGKDYKTERNYKIHKTTCKKKE
jgi:hypothetical protein